MKIIDISWPISKRMTGYKDSPEKRAKIVPTRIYSKHGANESRITLSSHTGTHVDAPKHFLGEGKTLGKVKLETFVGKLVQVTLVVEIVMEHSMKNRFKKGPH